MNHSKVDFYDFITEHLEYLQYLYRNMPHNDKVDFNRFLNFCYKLS